MKRIFSLLLTLSMLSGTLFSLCGCTDFSTAKDITKNITPQKIDTHVVHDTADLAVTDFSARLFKVALKKDENTLISPLSVLYALAMTANGADGNTKAEFENTFKIDINSLNSFLNLYMSTLPQDKKYKLNLANSIWLNDDEGFAVKEDFLQTNADYYGAEIYETEFSRKTSKLINSWVKEKTDKMIPEILKDISPDAVMYLINALCFDAEWHDIYEDRQVIDDTFTCEDGKEITAEFMHSTESKYIEDDFATGFLKYYKDAKYAFVALLPNEGVAINDYVETLDGQKIKTLLASANDDAYHTVYTAIPKFETEYESDLSEILSNMGIKDAFSVKNADFSKLGSSSNGNLYINRVIHKTYISVNQKGTRAGAVTSVEVNCGSALPEDVKEVYLTRPFVYMLIDCENNIPFFMGTLMMP